MYCIGKKYKFELNKGIFYTGKVEEEDGFSIKVFTIRNEEVIINKAEIKQSIRIDINRTGVKHEQNS